MSPREGRRREGEEKKERGGAQKAESTSALAGQDQSHDLFFLQHSRMHMRSMDRRLFDTREMVNPDLFPTLWQSAYTQDQLVTWRVRPHHASLSS